jgi:hypothetical protein
MRRAAVWGAIWTGLGVLFGVWLAVRFGVDIAMTYWTAWALEKALSDPFLVYTSNVFALFSLRSLYFLLARSIERLRFLRVGLGVMLLLVAAKMLLGHTVEVSPAVSLIAIGCILGIAIAASKLLPERGGQPASAPCSHLDQINHVTPASQGCEECLRIGDRWVHLRMCLTCSHGRLRQLEEQARGPPLPDLGSSHHAIGRAWRGLAPVLHRSGAVQAAALIARACLQIEWMRSIGNPAAIHASMPPTSGRTLRKPARRSWRAT